MVEVGILANTRSGGEGEFGDGINGASAGDAIGEVVYVGEGAMAHLEVESDQIFVVLWCDRGRRRGRGKIYIVTNITIM